VVLILEDSMGTRLYSLHRVRHCNLCISGPCRRYDLLHVVSIPDGLALTFVDVLPFLRPNRSDGLSSPSRTGTMEGPHYADERTSPHIGACSCKISNVFPPAWHILLRRRSSLCTHPLRSPIYSGSSLASELSSGSERQNPETSSISPCTPW